jgi:hypothetical protein
MYEGLTLDHILHQVPPAIHWATWLSSTPLHILGRIVQTFHIGLPGEIMLDLLPLGTRCLCSEG